MSSLSKQAAKLTRGDGDFDAESLSHKPDTIDEVDRESDVSGSHVSAEDFQEESSGPAEIAQKENQLVKYSKIFVIVVILCVAAIMGYLTHRYISNQEDEDHKQQVRYKVIFAWGMLSYHCKNA